MSQLGLSEIIGMQCFPTINICRISSYLGKVIKMFIVQEMTFCLHLYLPAGVGFHITKSQVLDVLEFIAAPIQLCHLTRLYRPSICPFKGKIFPVLMCNLSNSKLKGLSRDLLLLIYIAK